jgi:hypothetical protein
MRKSSILYLLFCFGLLALSLGCDFRSQQGEMRKDWAQIERAGKLTLLTENSTLSFFEFKGKRMGFEYEILDTFCKAHQLKLEVKVVNKLGDFVRMLRKGEGDVVAAATDAAFRRRVARGIGMGDSDTRMVVSADEDADAEADDDDERKVTSPSDRAPTDTSPSDSERSSFKSTTLSRRPPPPLCFLIDAALIAAARDDAADADAESSDESDND